MKIVYDWIIKNAWNLFGVVGVCGTFYFSLIHVPDYVKDITTGKVNVVHESLINDVQELLFYDKEVAYEDIESFIRGKELKQGVSYPYTSDELLIQVQERFMSNKFIPLEKRESILSSIKAIRSKYSPTEITRKKSFNWVPLFSWFLSGIGIFVGVMGGVSIARKVKMDRETEVDIASGDIVANSHLANLATSAIEFERMVGEVLSELGVVSNSPTIGPDQGFDFEAKSDDCEFIVQVKRYRKLLGLGTAREFIGQVNESGKGGILVVSSGVTQRTKQLIDEHNNLSENQKIHIVVASRKSEVKEKLKKIFATNSSIKSKLYDA